MKKDSDDKLGDGMSIEYIARIDPFRQIREVIGY